MFNFYSKNFNNYKIIEKVLQMNTKKYRIIKLNTILYNNEKTNDINKGDNTIKYSEEKIENEDDIAQDDIKEINGDNSRKESLIQIESVC